MAGTILFPQFCYHDLFKSLLKFFKIMIIRGEMQFRIGQHRPVIRIAGFFYKLCTLVASSFIASLAACRVICTGSVRGWCTPHCPSYREIVCFEFITDIGCTLLVLAQFASVYSRTNSASRTNSTPVHSRTLIFAYEHVIKTWVRLTAQNSHRAMMRDRSMMHSLCDLLIRENREDVSSQKTRYW